MANVAVINGTANLCTAQTGSGPTTNVADRGGVADAGSLATVGPAILRIITTVGATPTCTYLIEGSADGTNFFAVPYATVAAPETPGRDDLRHHHGDNDTDASAAQPRLALRQGHLLFEHERHEHRGCLHGVARASTDH